MKSEIYRVTHTKEMYLTTGILASLAVLLQVLLYFFGGPYRNTSFSYSNLVSSPMLFGFMGGMVVIFLYEGGRRNGNLKNTVAAGVPRTSFCGTMCGGSSGGHGCDGCCGGCLDPRRGNAASQRRTGPA